MFLSKYSIVRIVVLTCQVLVYFVVDDFIYEERSPSYGEIYPCQYSPPTCEKSGLELGLAQDAGPPGNLAARQTDRQRASLFGKEGKRYLSKGISRENLEAAGTPGKK
jgi:hypothetical protein